MPWQPRICPLQTRKIDDSLITHTTLQRALKRLTFARPSTTYKRLLTKVSFQQVFNICLLLTHDRPRKDCFKSLDFPQNHALKNAKPQTGNVKKSPSRQYQSAGYRFATVIVSSILPLITLISLPQAKSQRLRRSLPIFSQNQHHFAVKKLLKFQKFFVRTVPNRRSNAPFFETLLLRIARFRAISAQGRSFQHSAGSPGGVVRAVCGKTERSMLYLLFCRITSHIARFCSCICYLKYAKK